MNYTIPAKETFYKGLRFRSRLEAKWAAFFDLVGIRWQYEPFDLPGWTPDFVLRRACWDQPFLCEVKPLFKFDRDVAEKLAPHGEHILLLGAGPVIDGGACADFFCWGNWKGRFPDDYWSYYHVEFDLRIEGMEPAWNEAHNLTRFTYPNG